MEERGGQTEFPIVPEGQTPQRLERRENSSYKLHQQYLRYLEGARGIRDRHDGPEPMKENEWLKFQRELAQGLPGNAISPFERFKLKITNLGKRILGQA